MSVLLSHVDVQVSIERLAREVIAQGWRDYSLIGIVTGGAVLAERLADELARQSGNRPPVHRIDITLYRDDLYTGLEKLALGGSDLPMTIDGLNLLLVDDVLFTGRTVRAALQVIYDYGRPNCVQLLTLVDRGHRELPIQPDFVGDVVQSQKGDKVVVTLHREKAEQDSVSLLPMQSKTG